MTRLTLPAALLALAACMAFAAAGAAADPAPLTVLLTADAEGHVDPCRECPHGAGLGGMARRATLVARLRESAGTPTLLLDAGNALAGPDSIDSGGAVIVRAYDALGYDAVNLAPGDLRLGKAALLDALKAATFAAVSANLLDASTGRPLARPYVVKAVGGRRVAVLGLSEAPAGWDYLPHLKKQLAGVRVRPPGEALTEWLPKAKAEADAVVLLYHGSARGLAALLQKAGPGVALVGLGGVRPDRVAPDQSPPVVAAAEHGKSVARAILDGPAGVEQVAVDDSSEPNPAMQTLLAEYAPPPEPAAGSPTPGAAAPVATADDGHATSGAAPADASDPEPDAPRRLFRPDAQTLASDPANRAAAMPPEAATADSDSASTAAPDNAPPADASASTDPASSTPPTSPAAAPATGSEKPGGFWRFIQGIGNASPARPAAPVHAPPAAAAAAAAADPDPQAPADAAAAQSPEPAANDDVPPVAAPRRTARAEAPPAEAEPSPPPAKAAAAAPGPKFCTSCGKKLAGAKFCTACGARVVRPAPAAARPR